MINRDYFAAALDELAAEKQAHRSVEARFAATIEALERRRSKLADMHHDAVASSRGYPSASVRDAAAALGEIMAALDEVRP